MPHTPSFDELLSFLAHERGVDFRDYKQSSLERRIQKRLAELQVSDYAEYLEHLTHEPAEIDALLNAIFINVTSFFRDPQAWEALRREALPRVLSYKKPGDTVRVWSAGCASGEEAYSIAILLADYFGGRASEFDLKIYATDEDEEALKAARRGRYLPEQLKHAKPEWKNRYFSEVDGSMQITRDIRKNVIFGRSNLVSDAPISHVDLLICRNVLIYFNPNLQQLVLQRFRYALEEGGILFLGKAESQLSTYSEFSPISPKWRIFMAGTKETAMRAMAEQPAPFPPDQKKEYEWLKTFDRHIRETLTDVVIAFDNENKAVTGSKAALAVWGVSLDAIEGKKLDETPLAEICPEIQLHLEQNAGAKAPAQFQAMIRNPEGYATKIAATLQPMISDEGNRVGTLLYAEDVTHQDTLRKTVEELETTAQELHSANEELETTNEELQSTNEELETTNEELQSTNEELETTNEELHSLNEELETTNEVLEMRTRELETASMRYQDTLRHLPVPLILVNERSEVLMWNSFAERVLGVDSRAVVGANLSELPLPAAFRTVMRRRVAQVLEKQRPVEVDVELEVNGTQVRLNMHMAPVINPEPNCVLISFPMAIPRAAAHNGRQNGAKAKNGKSVPKGKQAATAKRTSARKTSDKKR